MDKILSINTIKNVFAALGAKTSDDNYGVALLDKTTAEPKGLMGMSDLASLLGGILFAKTLSTTYTFTNAPDGLYFISGFNRHSDSPISTNNGGLFIKINNDVRVLIDAQGSDGIYAKYGGSAWKKIC